MHPLNEIIDTSFHRPRKLERRRSSLDNSSLAAPECFAAALLSEDEKDEFAQEKTRRLSLGSKLEETNTTFLAKINSSKHTTNEQRRDLDSDRHDSHHNPATSRCPQSSHSKATANTASFSSDDDDSASSDNDHESIVDHDFSDCDSFCDASTEEPAIRAYLRSDSCASSMWSDDSSDFLEFKESSARTESDKGRHHHPSSLRGDTLVRGGGSSSKFRGNRSSTGTTRGGNNISRSWSSQSSTSTTTDSATTTSGPGLMSSLERTRSSRNLSFKVGD